jgi:hypothetical protein
MKPWGAVLRIRIHRIHMFLGLLDLDPSVSGMDTDPDLDPSITFDFLSLKMMYMYLEKVISKKTFLKISFLLPSWEGQ